VHAFANDTLVNNTIFAVASSTGSATTTLFSVTNAGLTSIGNSSGTGNAIFQIGNDSNAWALGYSSTDKSFRIASSTDLTSNVFLTMTKGGALGIGTTSPRWGITVASSTRPQIGLRDGSLTTDGWSFRTINNNFYLATTSPSGNMATSTVAAMSIDTNGIVSFAKGISVSSGGTGATTLTGILQGNGTNAVTALTDSSTAGQVLRVTGASTYAWGALDLADTDAVTGTLPDGNVTDALTVSGGTLGANTISGGVSWTTSTGTWTIGDGGASDRIDFATGGWDITNSIFTGGTWQGNDVGVAYGGTGLSTFGGTNHILYTSAADTLTSEAAFTYNGSTNLLTTSNASTTNATVSGYFESPLVVGGVAAGSGIENRATLGTGVGAEFIRFTGGTNGATEFARFQQNGFGIGTTSPRWALTVASSTRPQFALTDGSLTSDGWTFRSINNNFYLATSSPSGNMATSTVAALAFDTNGLPTFGGLRGGATVCAQLSATGNLERAASACGSGGGASDEKWATSTDQLGIYPNGLTNPIVGIGTTTPRFTLSVASSTRPQFALSDGSLTQNQWTFRSINGSLYFATSSPSTFATSTMSALTINTNGWLGIGTTTPSASLATAGMLYVGGTGTSTIAAGLNINSGAFVYDYGANKTSIERLDVGPLSFESDAGTVSWIDFPVTSSAPSGTKQSYSAQIDSFALLTVYAESDGAGSITKQRIGIGTSSPTSLLSIQQISGASATSSGIFIAASDGDYRTMYMDTSQILHFDGGSGNDAKLNAAGAWTNASDISYKENVENLTGSLSTVMNLLPRRYTMKGSGQAQIGFIAQEVDDYVPEVVEGEDGSKGISYGNLGALTIAAVKELASAVHVMNATTSVPTILSYYLTGSSTPTTTPAITIDSNGNTSIGAATSSLYKLLVGGDVAGTGFINVSTREAKKDITHITASTTEDFLASLKKMGIAQYRYADEDSGDPLRLGLIAEESPKEVLSIDGKGVDLYKLSTFTLAGLQRLALKVDEIEKRLAAIEVGGTGGGVLSSGGLSSLFSSIGIIVENGMLAASNIMATEFTVTQNEDGDSAAGSETIPQDETSVVVHNSLVKSNSKIFVTFTSSVSGGWYISNKETGAFTVTLSEAQSTPITFDYFVVSVASLPSPAPVNTGTTTPPQNPPTGGGSDEPEGQTASTTPEVPNEIPNDTGSSTPEVPNEIPNDVSSSTPEVAEQEIDEEPIGTDAEVTSEDEGEVIEPVAEEPRVVPEPEVPEVAVVTEPVIEEIQI
jgi:hypothetical protein